jgi:hypothetical protein
LTQGLTRAIEEFTGDFSARKAAAA